MNRVEAQRIADSLKPCPFCGQQPTARLHGPDGAVPNPSARCRTPDCMGSRLPSLCLDIPADVQAWNQRATGS